MLSSFPGIRCAIYHCCTTCAVHTATVVIAEQAVQVNMLMASEPDTET